MPFHTIPAIVPDALPNKEVTYTGPVGGAGECAIAVNPNDPKQMIMGVRQVPSSTQFTRSIVAAYYSADAGLTWFPSSTLSLSPPPPNAPWGGATDPAPAWDSLGNAYMLTLPVSADFQDLVGIAAYKSTDGGATWGPPILVDIDKRDDKPSVAIDTSGGSFDGWIYAIWNRQMGSANDICFARSKDHGATWIGPGTSAVGATIARTLTWASIAVSSDGKLYLAYRHPIGTDPTTGLIRLGVALLRSDDGGESFKNCTPVQDIIPLDQPTENISVGAESLSASHFREATFKVDFYVALCAGKNGAVFCAWPDQRNGRYPAIYFARSEDSGDSWKGSSSGMALTGVGTPVYDFQPQLTITPNGVVACSFYRFRPTSDTSGVIDVWLRTSFDNGKTFSDALRLNDHPWDPSRNATIVGTSAGGTKFTVTFIGDYFALAGGVIGPMSVSGGLTGEGFIAAWTDTRTGGPEIFCNRGFVGQGVVYDPLGSHPPYLDPRDPARLRFEGTAVLTAVSLVIVGLQIGLLSLTNVPRLLPESIGLSFGAGLLLCANLVRLTRESSAGPNAEAGLEVLDRDTMLSKRLGTAGILMTGIALASLILPLPGIGHDAALMPTFYSAVIGAAVAAISYVLLRERNKP